MKISIFETEHFEGAFPVIKLFDTPGNEITILTSAETHKRFIDLFGKESTKFKWTILSAKTRGRFFYSLYKNLKKQRPDILYINTISDNHLLYALVLWLIRPKRVVMTVHDINCLFESRPSLNFRKAVIHRGKKWLTKRVNEFNVVAGTMTPYLKTKSQGKTTHNVPGSVFEGRHSPQNSTTTLRIVVPGSLDKRRRDYEQVFKLAKMADSGKLGLKIILLGGFFDDEGETITVRARTFESEFAEISCYEETVVDQDEFDKQMDAAHFVFIPSVINTKICGDIPEIYGITKSSGNLFDVIKHAKPFMVPAGLAIPDNLQTSCFKYNSMEDLINFLKKIISSPADYSGWQKQALENSKNYTIEKVRERNAALFNVQNGNV